MSEIAKLVRFRSKLNVILFLILFVIGAWFTTQEHAQLLQWWTFGWMLLSVSTLIAWLASFGISRGFRFQKIWIRLRPGVVLRVIYWIAALSNIFSAAFTYILFAELREFNWYVAIYFALNLIVLLMCISIRYAIDADMKIRKVCEFC